MSPPDLTSVLNHFGAAVDTGAPPKAPLIRPTSRSTRLASSLTLSESPESPAPSGSAPGSPTLPLASEQVDIAPYESSNPLKLQSLSSQVPLSLGLNAATKRRRTDSSERDASPSASRGRACTEADDDDFQTVPSMTKRPRITSNTNSRPNINVQKVSQEGVSPSIPIQDPKHGPDNHSSALVTFRVITVLSQAVTLSVHREHTGDHIKGLIGSATGMDSRILVLVHNGVPIDPSKTLQELGFNNSSLVLARYPKSCLSLSFQALNGGAPVHLIGSSTDSLGLLKTTLASRLGLPPYEPGLSTTLALAFGDGSSSAILDRSHDNESLGSIGLKNGAKLVWTPLSA